MSLLSYISQKTTPFTRGKDNTSTRVTPDDQERLLQGKGGSEHDSVRAHPLVNHSRSSKKKESSSLLSHTLTSVFTLLLTLLLLWPVHKHLITPPSVRRCSNGQRLTIRREWRTLSPLEKGSYISALQCLTHLPSKLHPSRKDVSRYDDFAYTHYRNGNVAHESAMFLSWHRWFLALFEKALRLECGYRIEDEDGVGLGLPYWDWGRDWRHPEQSPTFDKDPRMGFGGNGDERFGGESVTGGWCLRDGALGGKMIPWYDEEYKNRTEMGVEDAEKGHCLSRKFQKGETFDGRRFRPDALRWVLEKENYWDMLWAMEKGPHDVMPMGLGGDFRTFYAPADPIFWLHHGGLDRLWSLWQSSSAKYAADYGGPSSSESTATARLDDVLPFGQLGRNVTVAEIMDTEGDLLCYRYDSYVIEG